MNIENFPIQSVPHIHVAFEPSTLESLIREGKLHASDFNCLDKSSQKGVWAMIRSAAASTLRLS